MSEEIEEVAYESLLDDFYKKVEEIERLNNRINKAIEYIGERSKTNFNISGLLVDFEIDHLLEILKGEDK